MTTTRCDYHRIRPDEIDDCGKTKVYYVGVPNVAVRRENLCDRGVRARRVNWRVIEVLPREP